MSALEKFVARANIPGTGDLDGPRLILAVGFESMGLLVLVGFGAGFWLLGYTEVAVAYWVFGGLLILNVVTGLVWGNINVARFNALTLTMVMPFVLMFFFGGFTTLGVSVAPLSLMSPMAAMMLVKRERAIPLVVGVVALLVAMIFLQPYASEFDPGISTDVAAWFAAAHLGLLFLTVSGLAFIVNGRLEEANRRAEALLLNILPAPIAERLKEGKRNIADSHKEVTILFADIVDFTPLSAAMTAEEVVKLLNGVFSTFDELVTGLGLEKIKTVGDEYMVAAGLPTARDDHATAIADFALLIRDQLNSREFEGHKIRMRLGINSGPVVAGVIGSQKFAYDMWGDVVNTASRLESEGIADAVQISESTYELIKDEFICEPRGTIPVKGKGDMSTYLLLSRRNQTP